MTNRHRNDTAPTLIEIWNSSVYRGKLPDIYSSRWDDGGKLVQWNGIAQVIRSLFMPTLLAKLVSITFILLI